MKKKENMKMKTYRMQLKMVNTLTLVILFVTLGVLVNNLLQTDSIGYISPLMLVLSLFIVVTRWTMIRVLRKMVQKKSVNNEQAKR